MAKHTKTVWRKSDGSQYEVDENQRKPEKGTFLIPPKATLVKPPSFDASKKRCRFDDATEEWVLTDLSDYPQGAEIEQGLSMHEGQGGLGLPVVEPDPPTYENYRGDEYGSSRDQLEYITENGLEAWQDKVTAIKTKWPKDESGPIE